MTTLTLELPNRLAAQLHAKQAGDQEIKAIVVATLELWLADGANASTSTSNRFNESGTLFARRLIQNNRELFETLAQR